MIKRIYSAPQVTADVVDDDDDDDDDDVDNGAINFPEMGKIDEEIFFLIFCLVEFEAQFEKFAIRFYRLTGPREAVMLSNGRGSNPISTSEKK